MHRDAPRSTRSLMHRFVSLQYAPAETRQLLRERLRRHLGREPWGQRPAHGGSVLTDEAMLRLLQNFDLSFGNEWAGAVAAYEAARLTDGSEPALQDRLAAGWARLVWGRVEVTSEVSLAFHRDRTRAGAFAAVLDKRFAENYRLITEAQLDDALLKVARDIERGEIEFRQLTCRSPKWVAARLWDQTLSSDDCLSTLRTWVDRWKLLGTPDLTPSEDLDGEAGERFRQVALKMIETAEGPDDWQGTYVRFIKERALLSSQKPEQVQSYLPAPPQTLVGRALWLHDNRITGFAYGSLDACEDILGPVSLLLAEIDRQPFSAGPHPIAARILGLAGSRPDLLFHITLWLQSHPRLLADLLLHPPTCALACLLIAQWTPGSSAYDRDLVQQGDELARAAAFEDAVSIFIWWLEKGLARPDEATALLAWLHQISGAGFIDDQTAQERLRLVLRDALLSLDPGILETIVDAPTEEHYRINRLGGQFSAALEIVAFGDLAGRIEPTRLLEQYIDAVIRADYNLSAHRIGNQSAAALFEIAIRIPSLLERFLNPIDLQQHQADANKPDGDPFAIADSLCRSLRTHIRVLSRAIVGRGQPVSDDLASALTSTIWYGALDHKDKGRVAAFAPRYETNVFGPQYDRPIAIDLAAALVVLSGGHRERLLSTILETDEPMMLAQLLPFAPHETRQAIELRLEALPPAKAGDTFSLPEVQARIDELLSAGALGAAEKFMAEEARIQTFGNVRGREVTRLRSALRLLFARHAWADILTTQLPTNFDLHEKEEATDIIQFYKGLALLLRQEDGDPEGAEQIFRHLQQRRPAIAPYAVNAIAARIGVLLKSDTFGRLNGSALRGARQVLSQIQGVERGVAVLTQADRQALKFNEAILRLALNESDAALALLPASVSALLEERVQAFRAVALFRLGRRREAVTVLKAAEENLGKTKLLEAAWEQILQGAPFVGNVGISLNDDPVARVREAYRALRVLGPMQQTMVVGFGNDTFTSFVVEQVRGATSSIVSLVSTMEAIKLDGCEDDITSVIRELLRSRLDFLGWSTPDQSKGGVTARGNPGERDLVVMHGSTTLTVIEAVICRNPIHRQTVQNNLRTHFQKLRSYGTCRLFFLLVYVYDQDIQGVLDQLKILAAGDAPKFLSYSGSVDIALTDSRPHGFIARYDDGQGELKIVFLLLDMGQERLKAAATASAKLPS